MALETGTVGTVGADRGAGTEVPRRPARPGRLEMFSALSYPNYRWFWLGVVTSVASQTMEHIALAWLVLDLSGSPFLLGMTGLAQAVPSIALALVGGALADRYDRRQLLILSMGLPGLLYIALGALVVTNLAQVWQVLIFAVILGVVRMFDQPARHGLLPHLVPREQIPNAVAVGSLAWQTPRPIGPAAAGLLIAAFGIGPTLFVSGLLSLGAAGCYALVQLPRLPRSSGEQGILKEMWEGLIFIRRDQVFYGLMGMAFFDSAFGMSYTVLLPVFARETLQVGSDGYGFLQTAAGVGGISGALGAAYLARYGGRGWQAILGGIGFGALIVALAYLPWYGVTLALSFTLGITQQMYMTTITTVLQLNVPDELRGRVMSVWGLTFRLIPVGGAVAGTTAEFAGAPLAMAAGGVLVVAMAVVVAAALPRVRNLA